MARPRLFGLLAVLIGLLAAPTSAAAATDATSTSVACSPSSPATGTATTCTATVTDTEASPVGTPGGEVSFGSSPDTGTFPSPAACTLDATGSCQLSFTPTAGGDYTITADYAGDADHAESTGTASVTAVDPTTTSLSCAPTTVQIDTSTACTATLRDTAQTSAPQPPVGSLTFSEAPTSGTFGPPGACHWDPSRASATCDITFTPSVAGPYTLSAEYGGDSAHGESTGTFRVTATTTPAGGGPGSHGGGGGTVTVVVSAGPPSPGRVTIASSAKVSRRHAAALALSCAGVAGSTCTGALTFTRRAKVKVRVRVKSKHHAKTGTKGRKTKTKIETKSTTVVVGSLTYSLATSRSQAVTFKLSRGAIKLLAKARGGRLKVQVWSGGSVVKTVTLLGSKHKEKHKRHRKHKKHKKK
jgi:hypothetical protein